MKIRIEVAARKSAYWPYFLQRAKKHGLHSIKRERAAGIELHIVQLKDQDAALEVWQIVRNWNAVWYYVGNRAVGNAAFNHQMWKYQRRDITAALEMRAALEHGQRRRDRGDWRMGMGDGPQQ